MATCRSVCTEITSCANSESFELLAIRVIEMNTFVSQLCLPPGEKVLFLSSYVTLQK